MVQKGDVRRLGWASDLVPGWMGAALFTSTKHAKLSFTVKSLVADIYLDDLRDKTLGVQVTSVLQQPSGKIIFTKIAGDDG